MEYKIAISAAIITMLACGITVQLVMLALGGL